MFGMLMSQIMRSGMLLRAISTPDVPSSADRVTNPYRFSDSAIIIRSSSASSITRTFFPAAPVRELPLAGELSGTVAVMRQKVSKSQWTVANRRAYVALPKLAKTADPRQLFDNSGPEQLFRVHVFTESASSCAGFSNWSADCLQPDEPCST